jgi:hypothetical protein
MSPQINPLKELPLREAYQFGIEHGLQEDIATIKNMPLDWGPAYQSVIRRGFIADLFAQKGTFDLFKEAHWPVGNTLLGENKISGYLALKKIVDNANSASPEAKEQVAKETPKNLLFNAIMEAINFNHPLP